MVVQSPQNVYHGLVVMLSQIRQFVGSLPAHLPVEHIFSYFEILAHWFEHPVAHLHVTLLHQVSNGSVIVPVLEVEIKPVIVIQLGK